MGQKFISQPNDAFRLGDFLTASLADERWTEFMGASAFVKRSGTKHIFKPLSEFSKRGGKTRFAAGIDAGGTSVEGLSDLLEAVGSKGGVYVYGNDNSSTFHPKIYLFQNPSEANLIIGSGNLTEGGLFTNYEANVLFELDLRNKEDKDFHDSILKSLDCWATPKDGECYALNAEVLKHLVGTGRVPDEKRAHSEKGSEDEALRQSVRRVFSSRSVPRAPVAPHRGAGRAAGTNTISKPSQPESEQQARFQDARHVNETFLMTLQNTDVGVGQTSAGRQRRSPEIFIPLAARNADPEFWGWPDQFKSDENWKGPLDGDGRSKMDRHVTIRMGGETFPATIWYNPNKRDIRVRSEHIRSAGAVGDILYMQNSNSDEFDYYIDVVPTGTGRHATLLPHCNTTVRNSQKSFGYL